MQVTASRVISAAVNAQNVQNSLFSGAISGTTVTEAATACGFTDPSYFSKCFRRAYGYSPSKCTE